MTKKQNTEGKLLLTLIYLSLPFFYLFAKSFQIQFELVSFDLLFVRMSRKLYNQNIGKRRQIQQTKACTGKDW